jgi:DNA-directed RNA polymerase specialized sigma24 family protein
MLILVAVSLSTPAEILPSIEAVALLASRRERFLGFLRRRGLAGSEAEEVLQDALLIALEHGAQLRESDRAVAWFYRILRRTAANRRRHDAVRQTSVLAEAQLATPEAPVSCPCSLLALEALPAGYAQILRQVELEERDLPSVAAALGTTVNSATVRLHRARKALRQQLKQRCGTSSVQTCLYCRC